MNFKLIVFIIASLFVGYDITDAYIVQPATRPDYCEDCIIPTATEEAQHTSLIETGLLGASVAAYSMKKKIKTKQQETK